MSLDSFVPDVKEIEIAGKAVKISPLKIRQIPGFSRAIGPVSTMLFGGDMMGAIAMHGEGLIKAVAIAIEQTEDWIGDLPPDEFLHLATAVVEVNGDFFVRRVRPALEETIEKVTKVMRGDGA